MARTRHSTSEESNHAHFLYIPNIKRKVRLSLFQRRLIYGTDSYVDASQNTLSLESVVTYPSYLYN